MFRTWDALFAQLSVQPAGHIAVLAGILVAPVCVVMSDGTGDVVILGFVDFTAGNGTEFTIGPGLNIEGLDGVDPTASAAGLDVSLTGRARLNFWSLTGAKHSLQALFACAVPNAVLGQAFAVGSQDGLSSAYDLFGGLYYDTGSPSWFRAMLIGAPPILNSSLPSQRKVVAPNGGTKLTFLDYAKVIDLGTGGQNRTAAMSGSYDITDPGASSQAPMNAAVYNMDMVNPRKVLILCEGKAASGFSGIVQKITAVGGVK